MMKWLVNHLVNGYVQATKFITTGGTSSQFVKGDGSLDGNSYALDSNVVHKTGNEDIDDRKKFLEHVRTDKGTVKVGDGLNDYYNPYSIYFGAANHTIFKIKLPLNNSGTANMSSLDLSIYDYRVNGYPANITLSFRVTNGGFSSRDYAVTNSERILTLTLGIENEDLFLIIETAGFNYPRIFINKYSSYDNILYKDIEVTSETSIDYSNFSAVQNVPITYLASKDWVNSNFDNYQSWVLRVNGTSYEENVLSNQVVNFRDSSDIVVALTYGPGYTTIEFRLSSSALNGYATESWADDKFLLNTTDTLDGDLTVTGKVSANGGDSDEWNNKATQQDIDDSIDAIEIGGRNLLLNSNFKTTSFNGWMERSSSQQITQNGYLVTYTSVASSARIEKNFPLNRVGTFTFSVKVKTDVDIVWQSWVGLGILNIKIEQIEDDFEIHSITFSNSIAGNKAIRGYQSNAPIGTTTLIEWEQLEKGNKATDWTPAPEDQITDWDETDVDSFSFLKNKPSSFPPSAHTHNISEVTNLQTALNNKEDSFSKNSAFNKDFGTSAGTVTEGNDSRLVEAFAKKVNSIVFTGDVNKTLTITREDGTTLTASFIDKNDPNLPDDVINTLEFNQNNDGVLTAITSEGEILNVSLDGRYSLIGHSHDIQDIVGLADALDSKVDKTDVRLVNAREWTASTVSQSEAEAGTSTTRRAWTAQRVRQAITAWWNAIANGNINQLILGNGTLSAALTASKLWGRGSTGNMGAISLGNGLEMDGSTLKLIGGVQDLNDTLLTGNTVDHETSIDVDIDYEFAINRNADNIDANSYIKFHGVNDTLKIDIRVNNHPSTNWDAMLAVRAVDGIIARTFGENQGFGISTFNEPIDVIEFGPIAWLRSDNLDLGTGDQTFQFPNKSGTLALEEDIDDKIEEYFENNPAAEDLIYPLTVVVDNTCYSLFNNARYLYKSPATEVCISVDPGGDDEGKEILILNDTGVILTVSTSSSPMRRLQNSSGGKPSISVGYRGRFRVINDELVEIG